MHYRIAISVKNIKYKKLISKNPIEMVTLKASAQQGCHFWQVITYKKLISKNPIEMATLKASAQQGCHF